MYFVMCAHIYTYLQLNLTTRYASRVSFKLGTCIIQVVNLKCVNYAKRK